MSKTTLLGSLAAALLTSGCAVSGPSLMPGFWVMLAEDEEQQQQEQCDTADCTQAKTTADDGEQEKPNDDASREQAK